MYEVGVSLPPYVTPVDQYMIRGRFRLEGSFDAVDADIKDSLNST
jgi:hypothetical protein